MPSPSSDKQMSPSDLPGTPSQAPPPSKNQYRTECPPPLWLLPSHSSAPGSRHTVLPPFGKDRFQTGRQILPCSFPVEFPVPQFLRLPERCGSVPLPPLCNDPDCLRAPPSPLPLSPTGDVLPQSHLRRYFHCHTQLGFW